MHEFWRERLSEYLDGELSPGERDELDRHLEGCEECRSAVAELRQVVARAQALQDTDPEQDLWAGIVERIGTSPVVHLEEQRRHRRVSFSVPQLLAAGFTLMMISAGAVWLTLGSRSVHQEVAQIPVTAASEPAAVLAAMPGFDVAVADLQLVLEERREMLDPATVRVLEESLALIDAAIEEAMVALERDPANAYLNQHLAANMRRKVRLLRQAATIATAAS
jgi:predicted anti-sigma-YlaC factor YlaD